MAVADIEALNERIHAESAFVERVQHEMGRVIVGQTTMVERLLVALLADGHVLLEGVPGLAKTLTVSTLASLVEADFHRIQFTPDLLPADLVGTLIYDQKQGTFLPKKGPIFANVILADEINRAPAKVQSALLEAMQERQVTIGETTYPLDEPFLVLATQNPIEQEGTYPLPEAQVDRFMLKVIVGYPGKSEEREILRRQTGRPVEMPGKAVGKAELIRARGVVRDIYMDEKVENYVVDLVHATREPAEHGLSELADLIEYGASPRATIYLVLAAKAHAFLARRGYVTPDDVRAIGRDVLRHRVILTYEAEAEETTSEDVVNRIFDTIEVP
ncbi:MAG: AAA family ATPase [Gemmatimonadota bacterium]|nr:AAA family ATPase [Gemmatimonadota bacterium]MDP6530207.1 AAA family ATPase [Gemmatimonadota bacterium]MDP6801603.1 AAA family ATPase [Gemmatimonadota bacterium]MDP7030850.1 AAA family ATPase [Gemmatimonadota bacterium]